MSKYVTIYKTFCTEFCLWPLEIEVQISDELCNHIRKCREILKYNPFMKNIAIDVPVSFLKADSITALQKGCFFDTTRIMVNDVFLSFYIQSKYSDMITAEYDMTYLIPHPLLKELGLEEEGSEYEVQIYNSDNSWINFWFITAEDGKEQPQRFKTREAAQEELDEAIENGEINPNEDEIRIIPVA